MSQKRLIIEWSEINAIKCVGTVTLDEWKEGQFLTDLPWRTTKAPVEVTQNSTGMKNFSKEIFTDEICGSIYYMMRHFFSGVCSKEAVFQWLDLNKD